MDIAMLRHFVAVGSELDLGRAAEQLGVSQAIVSGSLNHVESSVGALLIDRRSTPMTLTDAGVLFLFTARAEVAEHDAALTPRPPKAGGKAKASKGKGRAPRVKGEPPPYKKRQSR